MQGPSPASSHTNSPDLLKLSTSSVISPGTALSGPAFGTPRGSRNLQAERGVRGGDVGSDHDGEDSNGNDIRAVMEEVQEDRDEGSIEELPLSPSRAQDQSRSHQHNADGQVRKHNHQQPQQQRRSANGGSCNERRTPANTSSPDPNRTSNHNARSGASGRGLKAQHDRCRAPSTDDGNPSLPNHPSARVDAAMVEGEEGEEVGALDDASDTGGGHTRLETKASNRGLLQAKVCPCDLMFVTCRNSGTCQVFRFSRTLQT